MADYATLLRDHVTLTCRSVDRIFLQAYVPKLQTVGWVCQFLRWQRGFAIPSSAAFGKIGDAYVAEVHRLAKANGIPVRHFAKGENKEEIARPLIDAAAARGRRRAGGADRDRAGEGAGVAVVEGQGPRARCASAHGVGPADGVRQPLLLLPVGSGVGRGVLEDQRLRAVPDLDLAQRARVGQAAVRSKAGIGYTALDNGFASCEDPRPLQRICDRLGPGAVTSFFWRWQRRLPSPFTHADLRAGYVYELAFRQFEVSDTRVFDRPAAGRAFFEGLIRDHLDVGPPSTRWR